MRRLAALPLLTLPLACSATSDVDAGAFVTLDAGPADAGRAPDAGPASDAGRLEDADAGALADAGAPDTGPRPDAGALDGGSAPIEVCSEVTFTLSRPGASSVWVTGTFTGWAPTPAEGALELVPSGSTWTLSTTLPSGGRHQYKFIVDGGTWIDDPSNPERVDDGFGGFNSVLEVCESGAFEVRAHRTLGDHFEAIVAYVGAGDPASATLTVDRRLTPGALTTDGRRLQVSLPGLSDGIHDVRLAVGADTTLLKAYVNESTDWRDTTMYFVMTDRFVNGDPSNDRPVGGGITNPLADYLGGDFAGLRQKIEAGYFDALGVNALWLSWPIENTDGAFDGPYDTYDGCNFTGTTTTRFSAYHGYWPSSGTEIESRFGTREELYAAIDAAHARGIRILLDFTANHVHEDSPYYADHPEWFNLPAQMCRDGLWDGDLKEECWFDTFLPDWNFDVPGARRRVLDDAVEVAKDLGADGFRVDALKHMEDSFVTELRDRVEAELEGTDVMFYMVGETFTGDAGAIAYYVGPDMLHGQFDFPSNMAVRQGLATDEIGLGAMHQWVRDTKAAYGVDSPLMSTFAGNHDIARFVSKASGDLPCGIWQTRADSARAHSSPPPQPSAARPYARLRLALAYVYSVPGIPLLYYGDEVGLAGAGDPDNRRMLPEDGALDPQMRATREFVQRLGRLRADTPVLRTGDWTGALFADGDVLVFARTSPDQTALVVLNRGAARELEVDVGGLGLADGTTLTNHLGPGSTTVTGGRMRIAAGAIEPAVYLTAP